MSPRYGTRIACRPIPRCIEASHCSSLVVLIYGGACLIPFIRLRSQPRSTFRMPVGACVALNRFNFLRLAPTRAAISTGVGRTYRYYNASFKGTGAALYTFGDGLSFSRFSTSCRCASGHPWCLRNPRTFFYLRPQFQRLSRRGPSQFVNVCRNRRQLLTVAGLFNLSCRWRNDFR